jgi:hypothetical protein
MPFRPIEPEVRDFKPEPIGKKPSLILYEPTKDG